MAFIPRGRDEQSGLVKGAITFDSPALAGLQWPAAEIRGFAPGPRLCVMAGIHVNEVSSIEAAVRLQRRLSPERLRGTVSILPIVNLPAIPERSQYVCPVDGRNINFTFPGSREGGFSEALADALLTDWAAGAEVLIDLHGGDLCENVAKFSICQTTGDPAFDARNLELARCFDAEIIAALDPRHMKEPGRACTARARAGRLGVMSEAGANGIIEEESVAFHVEGVLNVAVLLGMIEGPPRPPARRQVLVKHYLWVKSPAEGMFHPTVEPGASVVKGHVLAGVNDVFGAPAGEVLAPEDGLILWRITHGLVGKGESVFGLGVPPSRRAQS